MRSRSRSACPLWRAYSSIMCTSSSRSETGSPSESCPTKSRPCSWMNWPANAVSSRHAAHASPDGRVGHRAVEVAVRVGLGLVAPGHVVPGEPAAEPGPFHLGHVPDQAEQRHRGRLHRTPGQLPGVEPIARHPQRQRLVAQELVKRRPLVSQPEPPSRGSEAGSRNRSARCCGVITPTETTRPPELCPAGSRKPHDPGRRPA